MLSRKVVAWWALVLMICCNVVGCTHGELRHHSFLHRRLDHPDVAIPPATVPPPPVPTSANPALSAATNPLPEPGNRGPLFQVPPDRPQEKPTSEDVTPTPPKIYQTSTQAPAIAAPTSAPADPMTQLRALYRRAAAAYAPIDSYIARLHRREVVNGKSQPEEVLTFKFRKLPWSVSFKWIGTEGNGRECIYVKGQYGDQIHTLLAAGDIPFMPAGKRMAVAPDNVFVRSRTRHTITEAGLGAIIDKYGVCLDAIEKGDTRFGTLNYLGLQKRPEYEAPMQAIERTIPPGVEPGLPHGGRRWLMFDSTTGLPALTITQDEKGQEVEYYCFDLFQFNVGLDDNDFNPDKLWPPENSRRLRR